MMIRVTAIIPVHFPVNIPNLGRAVDSLKKAATLSKRVLLTVCLSINGVSPSVSERSIVRSLKFAHSDVVVVLHRLRRGFAPAVNDGIIYAKATLNPDWYLVLNDDAWVHEDFFVHLHDELVSNKNDVVTCAIAAPDGSIESVGLFYSKSGLAFPHQNPEGKLSLPVFTGACVLLSAKRVDREYGKHGYIFNPIFFAYAEDVELSLRIHRDGGKMYIHPKALVTHLGSQTAKRGSFFQLYHGYRNSIATVLLLWSPWKIVSSLPFLLVGHLYILAMSFYKRHGTIYPRILWWLWRHRKILLYQRQKYSTLYG